MKEFSTRQLQIINTSIALIGEGGIQELTIKNLSKRIGFVEAAVYRHFPSKSEILMAILSYLESKVHVKFTDIIGVDISPIEKLKETINAYLTYFAENPALITVHFSDGIYKNEPQAQQKVLKILDDTKLHFEKILEESQSSAEIRTDINCSDMALVIVGTLRITVNRWSLQNNKIDVVKEVEKIYSLIKTLLSK